MGFEVEGGTEVDDGQGLADRGADQDLAAVEGLSRDVQAAGVVKGET